jgi:hypothetical protein
MIVIPNSISDSLASQCISEIDGSFHSSVWRSSSLIWNDDLKIGLTGSCLISDPSLQVSEKIESEIKKYVPSYRVMKSLYYVWQSNSGISNHNDYGYLFGATIYLNTHWDINWGGIFIWNKSNEDHWRAIVPRFKSLVLNDSKEDHLVTSISPLSETPRVTIQIWAK